MSGRVRVIALGRRLAGDDGVGPAILDALGGQAHPALELREAGDPAHLISLLCDGVAAVVVDAVVGEAGQPAGQLVELAPEQLAPDRAVALHGLTAAAAIELARALAPAPACLRLVGVVVAPPAPGVRGLSPEVAAAVPVAAARVLQIVREILAREAVA